MEGIIECSPDRRGAAREQAAHRLAQYRRYGAARVSKRLIDYGASRGASGSSGVETLKSGLLIVEHFKNVLKAQNLERVLTLGVRPQILMSPPRSRTSSMKLMKTPRPADEM